MGVFLVSGHRDTKSDGECIAVRVPV